jgi:hypothetical protein
MKKIYKTAIGLAILGAGVFVNIANAQNSNSIYCGDDLIKKDLEKRFPGFKEATDKTFKDIQQLASFKKSNGDYTVNVVVHVVWKDVAENLADSIIQSQIDVLNEDYNRLNPDTANLRTFFNPIASSAKIHFNLAQVIRKQTTVLFTPNLLAGGTPNQMKWDSLGGSSAVDPDHFLNLWVCKIQPLTIFGIPAGQILGFAFPPASLANWPAGSEADVKGEDGVVIDYRCIGRNNPNPISADGTNNLVIRGRTASHEFGHYLGLRHIWGDGGGLGGGGNNCTGNDGIADTPKADAQSNFDCDTTKNSCVDTLAWTTTDAPDLVENYMDYSTETCMNMFTAGQVAHIQATLDGPRNTLLQPAGLNAALLDKNTRVYPNPAKDKLTVSTLDNQLYKVELIDVLGKSVLNFKNENMTGNLELDINAINGGTYFVRAYTKAGMFTTKKVLIVK